MIWLEMLLLAFVQGVGEFLPISSSGHVVVGLALCRQFGHPIADELTVNIVLHVGTLLAILIFYRRRILDLLGQDRRVIGLLIVGSIPAAIVGLLLKEHLEGTLKDPLVAGLMFPITGAMLLWTARWLPGKATCRELGYGHALLIGVFQAFAIMPGISRSGATIVAGLGTGLRRDEAATFSFLLAIPAIGGAGLIECVKLAREATLGSNLGVLAVGAAVSFVVGWASLWWLVRWLQQGWLHYFAWWVIPLGLVVIAWQLLPL
ncbi:MAG: undecaprenyl-diphosphate phosphatase [Pirellulales bacterium]|nr:undecaprenyl-diphosphate phosphatase [Pirellulales bacterium]